MIREINDHVSQSPAGQYYMFWSGNELLLTADSDAAAVQEADDLLAELATQVL